MHYRQFLTLQLSFFEKGFVDCSPAQSYRVKHASPAFFGGLEEGTFWERCCCFGIRGHGRSSIAQRRNHATGSPYTRKTACSTSQGYDASNAQVWCYLKNDSTYGLCYTSEMNNLKNVAGNDVSIFLFRFEIRGNAISFVINQGIGEDMYPDVDEKLKPLAHACCETLSRYRHVSVSDTIMDGNILETGEFEVMLSKGLGRYFPAAEKQLLFQDAKRIADLLIAVMERRTKEEKEGKHPLQSNPHKVTASPTEQYGEKIKQGLEQLGRAKSLQAELQWLAQGKTVRPGLRRLRPDDLPSGVTASRGYDHRGHCYLFEHKRLGELGKIVLITMGDGRTVLQAELHIGQDDLDAPLVKRKKKVFEHIVATVDQCFDENIPE